jgi:hypothetical protein
MNYKRQLILDFWEVGNQQNECVQQVYKSVWLILDTRFDKTQDEVALLIWFLVDHFVF